MALLELEEVRAGYGPTSVLHGISMSVPDGGIVSLLGANGAGKTTTLRAITAGVHWSGDIRFSGRSLRRMHTEDIVRGGIAHVPEGRGILIRCGLARWAQVQVSSTTAWSPPDSHPRSASSQPEVPPGLEVELVKLVAGLILSIRQEGMRA